MVQSKGGWNFDIMSDETAYLTEQQVDEIIDAVQKQPYNLIIRLLWRTGARITEILNIKKIDINFVDKEINIKTLKLKRKDMKRPPRKVPIYDEPLMNDLSNWTTNTLPRDFIFKKTSRFNVYYQMRKAAKQIGIEEVGEDSFMHPHILRHSFAIHWVKQGLPLTVLRDILGHTSVQTTGFYQKFNTKDLHEYIEKMWKKKDESE